jgi:hypothetical protein
MSEYTFKPDDYVAKMQSSPIGQLRAIGSLPYEEIPTAINEWIRANVVALTGRSVLDGISKEIHRGAIDDIRTVMARELFRKFSDEMPKHAVVSWQNMPQSISYLFDTRPTMAYEDKLPSELLTVNLLVVKPR